MNLAVMAPILLPLTSAILALAAWRAPGFQRWAAVAGTFLQFGAALALLNRVNQSGIQTFQVGSWPAPFGITLAVDLFGAIMLAVSGQVGLSVALYALNGIDDERVAYGFYPLFHILLMGVNGAFATGDLFNLYVWFEVMLMASFVLMALGGTRAQLEGSVKYVVLNLLASSLFLSATGLLYGLTGTLNLAQLALVLPETQPHGLTLALSMLYLVAFGIKAAIFPLFFWLPASYHTPPVAVTALFSGLLTKVGAYAMLRVFTLIFRTDPIFTNTLFLVLAGLTMVTGVLGAAAQWDFRRLLSFHIISQIGYLVMGLGLASQAALAGAIYFMVHVILAKTALFLIAGIVERLRGSFDLHQLGGLYRSQPWLALGFALPALALAGLPPFSGFFAKLMLVRAGLEAGQYIIVFTALGVSLLTLFSMSKVWGEVFWKPAAMEPAAVAGRGGVPVWMILPTALLVVGGLLLGLFAEPAIQWSHQAAFQLLHPDLYIQAVLGGLP
ncbi:MAG TPA: Na+/H+ antiporter subunit D [Anaerolinea thermolimosa]|uniref:Na+/H+ antiporter subunit D n=1 Tax=Anaerolinea thermolimosa TaxID=229919 RepID=A0A3D1JER1_9CHLR|nr:Na+/H+ antiporter subunit D [Anaerolinea thermolimosa]